MKKRNIKIGNIKIDILQTIRLLVQIMFFILLPALFIQALNGVKVLYLAVISQNFSADLLPQTVELIALIPITMIAGRFFCGWMCGFGAFTDFIYLISGKIMKRNYKISRNMDAALKYVKYILLVVLIIFAWTMDMSIFNSLSPWDVFGMVAIVGKMPDLGFVISNLTIAFVLFILIMIASVFVERFFCRYLCPMGAVFAICSKLRIGKIKKPTEKCGKCMACTNNCAMGIPLNKMEAVSSGECINCMKCVSICPRSNTSYSIAKKDIQPLIVSAVSVAVMTGSYYTVYAATNNIGTAGSTIQTSESSQQYVDGTYEGTGTGFRGTTKVSVVVSGGKITKITTVSYKDDAQYYNKAFTTISKSIISSQSADVDAVSGATYSSQGIMEAVQNALSQAKVSEISTVSEAATQSATTNATQSATSPAQSATTATKAAEAATSANSAATTKTTEPTTTAATAAATAAATGKYVDGTYQGSGTGFRGTTTVSVVVSGGKITTITTVSYKDDAKYYNKAYSTVSKSIISSQSADVDAVSGATYSSNGIMKAVENALSGAIR